MSTLEPTFLNKDQMDKVKAIEALPRKERRKLGKSWGTKIPGSNKPIYEDKRR